MQAHLDGQATDEQIRYLQNNTEKWTASLFRLLDTAEMALASARRDVSGSARAMVLVDLDEECFRIDVAITGLVGDAPEDELIPLDPVEQRSQAPVPAPPPAPSTSPIRLQLSRTDGRIVAWASGLNQRGDRHEGVLERVKSHGG